MTPALQQYVLDFHNKIRSKVATGQDMLKGNKLFPTASNMLEMVIYRANADKKYTAMFKDKF